VLDGAYPYASKSRRAEIMFNEEIASGALEVMYVTGLPVMTTEEYAKADDKDDKKADRAKAREAKAARAQAKADAKAAKKQEAADKKEQEAADESKKEAEGDADVFNKGSIDDAMGEAKQVAGTVSETVQDGEVAKLAGRMDMDVSVVEADSANKKNIGDPLLQAGTTAGQVPVLSKSAAKAVKDAGITNAECTLITATGKDGVIIQKDVKAYLKTK